jgi:putative Mg2+ transporter-C (MgtC) family protein
MPLHPAWDNITLRLVLTILAGGVIGFNRGVRGEAAGLRTTILVGLAASVAMIQANILLSIAGKTADSFGVMDLMRLPLGILTGVGFIGAGTILRRDSLTIGVTTAATLWVITVIGLCFGGGQLGLGIAATLLSLITLWGLKWVDAHIPREQRAAHSACRPHFVFLF